MPVGRIEYLHLGPMTFDEFLLATDNEIKLQRLREFSVGDTFSEALHASLIEDFRKYCIVGGMPGAIQTYLDTNSYLEVQRVLEGILLTAALLMIVPKPKTEQTLYCEMNGTQRKEYNKLRDYYRAQLTGRVKEHGIQKSKIHVLEALLHLRQMACHSGLLDTDKAKLLSPKLETLLEQLQEVVTEGHKALIFSQFTSLLHIVQRHLDQAGITYEYLDGRTRKRADKVKRFQTDPQCSAFLISLKAGGHGLNLTAADYVFILDPWWNPAVESQAIDRAHRIGQTRPVFAYRLICADTVENKILELQQSKRELADAIISADQSFIRNLTAEDLQLLLS